MRADGSPLAQVRFTALIPSVLADLAAGPAIEVESEMGGVSLDFQAVQSHLRWQTVEGSTWSVVVEGEFIPSRHINSTPGGQWAEGSSNG